MFILLIAKRDKKIGSTMAIHFKYLQYYLYVWLFFNLINIALWSPQSVGYLKIKFNEIILI